jgi:GH25 family lysozyme M1 (1,4-beta-N-acetylmuramidase)
MHILKSTAAAVTALALSLGLSAGAAQAAPVPPQTMQTGPEGIDVSHYQTVVVWATVALNKRFAYIKATEGTTVKDTYFDVNYLQSYLLGMIRGAYHFARPARSNGMVQADYFIANGGGWSADGRTLPGALDLEGDCAGLSPAAMVQWIHQFADRYRERTGRQVVIYTNRSWWNTCTGGNGEFAANNPLWYAEPDPQPQLPNGWSRYTFWQYSQSGSVPGVNGEADLDVFNGSDEQLVRFATTG